MTTDLTAMTVPELQAALADGATSVDVAQAYLDRIASTDGELGAYLHVDPEASLAAAAAIDAAGTRGHRPGRCPRRAQGRRRHRGRAHHQRLEDPRGLAAALRRDRRRPAQGQRHRAAGQDQHGRVRHGLLHGELRLPDHPQPVGPRAHPGRLLRRLLGRGGRRPRALGHRHRHRWLDPPARRGHGPRRAQAHLRVGLPLRPDRLLLEPGPGRSHGPHGPRRGPAARGDRRARPAGLHEHRRPGAGARRVRPPRRRRRSLGHEDRRRP